MKTATKVCTLCKRDLPFTEYNRDNSRPDGLRARCRTCRTRFERKGKKAKQVAGIIPMEPVPVKNRETAYRQALIDLHYKYPDDFKELLQVRLREALSR